MPIVLGGCYYCIKWPEKMVRTIEETRQDLGLALDSNITVTMKESEVEPKSVHFGNQIKHTFIYAFYGPQPAKTYKGKITRKFYFKGNVIDEDTKDFEFKPGTWSIDSCIIIPKDAENGIYVIRTILEIEGKKTQKDTEFILKRRKK